MSADTPCAARASHRASPSPASGGCAADSGPRSTCARRCPPSDCPPPRSVEPGRARRRYPAGRVPRQ
jgi:hypothetical protein